jgi:mannose-6-phosphate isomerase
LAPEQPRPRRIDGERTLLVRDSHFIIERLDLPESSESSLQAERETWLLIVAGSGLAGSYEVGPGSVVFAVTDCVAMKAGARGMTCIIAYTGAERPQSHLLRRAPASGSIEVEQNSTLKAPAQLSSANATTAIKLERQNR